MQKIYLEQIPIIKPKNNQITEIELICKEAIDENYLKYQNIINNSIFTLYNFSQEEIKYIESDNFEELSDRK